jgi:hypothetical protein
MKGIEVNQPRRSSRRAVILGVLLPVVLGPVALVAMGLAARWGPLSGPHAWYMGGLNLLAYALVPESAFKDLIVPIVTVLGWSVLPGGALTGVASWMILRSVRLALIAGAVAVVLPVVGIILVVVILTLMA